MNYAINLGGSGTDCRKEVIIGIYYHALLAKLVLMMIIANNGKENCDDNADVDNEI